MIDRSIVLQMQRKTSAEPTDRFRRDAKSTVRRIGEDLASAMAGVTDLSHDDLPDDLSDRAQDNWEPLMAIAAAAGGEWPGRALRAAVLLSAGGTDIEDDRSELVLLRDIRAIFEAHGDPPFLTTLPMVMQLRAMAEAPWGEEPRPLTAHKLGQLMRIFKIKSGVLSRGTPRGYFLAHIDGEWDRLKHSAASLAHLVPAMDADPDARHH